ncbi:MAG: hypothetical protein Q7S69_01630 [Nitrosomonadaceae bacterium]|nr:hypothetical protein [Nitrosomonadaceae bacterium]
MVNDIEKVEQSARTAANELPTQSELISKVTDAIREAKDTDVELLDILSEKILTMNPAATAVANAVKAIENLAVKRAEASVNDQNNN